MLALALSPAASAAGTTVTVLFTTDLHGYIYPYDYAAAKPANWGLAKAATLIRQVQRENPRTILIDAGDTIQGSPLEAVYQHYVTHGEFPLGLEPPPGFEPRDPMMAVMNHLRYDAMVLGNHEFNFGLANLKRAKDDARFPWLSANIVGSPDGDDQRFPRFVIREFDGFRLAVIGITTPGIPAWEKPEHFAGHRFRDTVEAAREAVQVVREKGYATTVVLAVHAGLERDPKTGAPGADGAAGENMVHELATKVEGVDAIVFGHTHQEIEQEYIGDVLICQPKNWGMSVARLDFEVESEDGEPFRINHKGASLLRVTGDTPPDPDVLRIAQPYHEITERYLNIPVATSEAALGGRLSQVSDVALVDAIHAVQLHYSGADVSFTSSLHPRVAIPNGQLTIRHIVALCPFENELYVVEGNGRMVREALENSARYFLTCPPNGCAGAPLVNPRVLWFNYDTAQGVEYRIDLRQPEGKRIRDLRFRGKPLADDQKLRVAINSYRAAGSAGFTMFKDAPVVWRSGEGIRELMIRYYQDKGALPGTADANWSIAPAEALDTLRRAHAERR